MKAGILKSEISDGQELVSVTNEFGMALRIYDGGFGPLWIHRGSLGITGVVRAKTWEDAYSICEDEFFPAADEEHEGWVQEYGENYIEDAGWNDCYGFRSNSRNEPGGRMSSIYQRDLNGDRLDRLTPELAKELGLTVMISES